MTNNGKLVTCHVTGEKKRLGQVVQGYLIRPGISRLIKKRYPDWTNESYISRRALKEFRKEYIENMLKTEKGELSQIDKEVVQSLLDHEILTKQMEEEFTKKSTFGERVADKIASFGGSWKFIGIFAFFLVTWIIINTIILIKRPYDPYPFILLNLMLSCLAAIQAPVIMMSQNRLEARDRIRTEGDYKTDLKAELEIRHLHEKIDHLIKVQWQRLLEIQQLQLDMMEEVEKEREEHELILNKDNKTHTIKKKPEAFNPLA